MQHSIYASSCWFQVSIEETLAGVVRLQSDYVRYCCIYDLLVDKKHRSKGVGSALMEAAVQWCDQRQIQIVHLWPATGRVPFFERFGFQPLSDKHPMMIRSASYPVD
ncbi:GNAT family N-acetyltransferase [Endozoicomonas sp.]|uniref:GNAT family N-acetyltransferase n=1 Tax=Endozoicomonas sp. TaxID=1892382 RepID=UPI003AF7F518